MKNEPLSPQKPILVLSSKPWNSTLAERINRGVNRSVEIITSKNELTPEVVGVINPEWIFVPHWSHLIPETIWGRWPTVIFHMTDLPYGRGGSPLQNLIQRGHTETMMTALRCCDGFDTGDVYLKEPLDLHGSAEEIYLKADELIEKMIKKILHQKPEPVPQQGKPVVFSRRTPAESDLSKCSGGALTDWYDQIRMLDAEGYPHAFLEVNGMRLEFRRVSQRSDGLYADVKIVAQSSSHIPKQDIPS